MSKSLSKNALIAEIAAATNLDKTEVTDVLNKLTEISYREAINGFIIPGICKLKVVTKKASRCRNPATGKLLLIGERQVLKVIPISKAKEIITPKVENLIQVIADVPLPVEKIPIAPIVNVPPPVEIKPQEEKKPGGEMAAIPPPTEKILTEPIVNISPPVEIKPVVEKKPVEETANIPSPFEKKPQVEEKKSIETIAAVPPPFERKPLEEKKPAREEPREEFVFHKMPEGSVPPPFPDLPVTAVSEEKEIPQSQPDSSSSPSIEEEPDHKETPSSQPDSSLSLGGDGGQIVFNCISCGTMLAAPPTSAGSTCTCPFCSVMNLIPSRKKDSEITASAKAGTGKKPETPSKTAGADFITFVCQTCGQEIEAPIDMMGMDASCPTCASSLHVPASFTPEAPDVPVAKPSIQPAQGANMSSMTIRIDLSDLE